MGGDNSSISIIKVNFSKIALVEQPGDENLATSNYNTSVLRSADYKVLESLNPLHLQDMKLHAHKVVLTK